MELNTRTKAFILLGVLEDSDLDWIVRNGTKYEVAAGTVLIREDTPIDSVYFLLSGELKITSGIDEIEIIRLHPGEIVGEMSLIDSRPPSATATATCDSLIGAVARDRLQDRLRTDLRFSSRFYQAIAVLLSLRLRTTVRHLGYGKPPEVEEDFERNGETFPHLGESLPLVQKRFIEMKTRPWGD